jgi:hypothetical protein
MTFSTDGGIGGLPGGVRLHAKLLPLAAEVSAHYYLVPPSRQHDACSCPNSTT